MKLSFFLNLINNQIFINQLKQIKNYKLINYKIGFKYIIYFSKINKILAYLNANQNHNINDLKKFIQNFNLNFQSSVILYRLSLVNNHFLAAYFFRKKFIYFLSKKNFFFYFRYFLNLSIENFNIKIYRQIDNIKILKKIFKNEIISKKYIFSKNYKNINNKKNKDKNSCLILDLIKGKKIAIIGPSRGSINKIELINFDTIIFLNEISIPKYLATHKKILYLNGFFLNNYSKHYTSSFSKFDLICLKEGLKKKITSKSNKIRYFDHTNNVLLGSGYMLTNIIFDLIQYRPKKIKAFNFDFFADENGFYNKQYLGNTILKRSYYKNFKDPSINFKMSFAIHDVYGNFLIIKSLFKRKIVLFDNKANRILNKSVYQYAIKLEFIFNRNNFIK